VKAWNLSYADGNRTGTEPSGNLTDWPIQHNRSGPSDRSYTVAVSGPILPICLRLKGPLFRPVLNPI